MFTIKSTSEDGVYYLVREWRKNKAIWKTPNAYIPERHAFISPKAAKQSLTCLLKAMPEYALDTLEVMEV